MACFDNTLSAAILLATGAGITHYEVPMIRANCRARFTAADFDFIVRTLARSQTDQVSLVDLLSDVETRDSILDHPRLVEATRVQSTNNRITHEKSGAQYRAMSADAATAHGRTPNFAFVDELHEFRTDCQALR